MKKTFLFTTAMVIAGSVSFDAQSEERWPRWYIGLKAGATFMPDQDYNANPGPSGTFESETGYNLSGALGYKLPFEDGFLGNSNLEAELGYSNQGIDGGNGETEVSTYAINYIFDVPSDGSISPYLGAGIGYADVEITGTNPTGVEPDDTFAFYQLMIGLGFEPETIPRTTWLLGYKYQAAFNDPTLTQGGVDVDYEFDNHIVEGGVRFNF